VERLLLRTLPHGGFVGVTKGRSKQMRAIRGHGNKTTEARLRSALMRAGVRGWRLSPKEIAGQPDFYFRKARLAVFVDGCFWHGCPRCGHIPKTNGKFWLAKIRRNRARDRMTARRLRALGLCVVRIWEHDLDKNLVGCLQRLRLYLQR
jgi:DNA mismatch endonuclease, patch repair protein